MKVDFPFNAISNGITDRHRCIAVNLNNGIMISSDRFELNSSNDAVDGDCGGDDDHDDYAVWCYDYKILLL